jgi:hypothetical protein
VEAIRFKKIDVGGYSCNKLSGVDHSGYYYPKDEADAEIAKLKKKINELTNYIELLTSL